MITEKKRNSNGLLSIRSRTVAVMLVLGISSGLATGCGSTKVYSPDKTIEFRGSIYNVSDTRQLSTRMEATTTSGEVIDLRGYDSKQVEAMLQERGPLQVRSMIALDDTDLVFEQKVIEKKRDFEKMQKTLAEAYKDLTSFMADARETQLKL